MSLIEAINRENYELADQLIMNRRDLDETNSYGNTPLMLLLRILHPFLDRRIVCLELITKLIDAGADVNIKDCDGYTALFCAVIFNHKIYTVRMLIDASADVNIKNNYGKTALSYVVKKNRTNSSVDTVKMLIEADF